jgi:membrane fusion protein, multidrug efflux system
MRHLLLIILALWPLSALAAEPFKVHAMQIADSKAVIATVEPLHQVLARARIGGTIASLHIKEGDVVAVGQELAVVADQKLVLQLQSLNARILSLQAQRDQARTDFDRIQELQKRGVTTTTQLDLAHTNLDVADRSLQAMQSDRNVLVQQTAEGAVLAPTAGRVLKVPVSDGAVIMQGETIATLAEETYILRLQLPERHARFMRAGDKVLIGARGLSDKAGDAKREGRVRLVYPEIQGGRVIADVEVMGLDDYFVGERTLVYINTGNRMAVFIPLSLVELRSGVTFVKRIGGADVVVQTGERRDEMVEILAGLKDGDQLVQP